MRSMGELKMGTSSPVPFERIAAAFSDGATVGEHRYCAALAASAAPSFTQGSAAKAPSPRHVAHENYLTSVPATNSVSSNTALGQRAHGGTAIGQLGCKRSPADVIDHASWTDSPLTGERPPLARGPCLMVHWGGHSQNSIGGSNGPDDTRQVRNARSCP